MMKHASIDEPILLYCGRCPWNTAEPRSVAYKAFDTHVLDRHSPAALKTEMHEERIKSMQAEIARLQADFRELRARAEAAENALRRETDHGQT